jgi:phenylpyruvate tautomerase PptA (4-oxalocrotonate tautomerase family)
MPTYVCSSRAATLTTEQRATIAAAITRHHSHATGAPASFTQVIFQTIDDDHAHFIGGRPADPTTVFVHGNIRQGRTAAAKQLLITGIRDIISDTTGLPHDAIWVYLTELVPQQMIEFGQQLPDHGHEQEWMDALPETLRRRLEAFDR